MRDAFVLAARFDYAVAANLNVFLSFLRAERTSNGYSWGCIGPNAGLGAFPATPDGNINLNLNRYPASPNIPDGSLGAEIMLGLDWKLLEQWFLGNHCCILAARRVVYLRMCGSICSGLGNRDRRQSLWHEPDENHRSCYWRGVHA